MRSISNSILNKLNSRVQAGKNKLSASLWVGRPVTPLVEDRFLEKQNAFQNNGITAIDISVCRPQIMRGATYVYVAYIESGVAKVKRAKYREDMADHVWEDLGFQEEAIDVSICFDGEMPKSISGYVEFVTETEPWIFWVNSTGTLYGKKLGQEEPILLAETNCSKVSSVRAMWSDYGNFDFGLVIFFLLNGKPYYRQLSNKEWLDAEVITFGPDTTYSDIAAFRTWDYRIGIQVKTTENKFYELFTQFMGVGKQNTEHVTLNDIKIKTGMVSLTRHDLKLNDEHVTLSSLEIPTLYKGLYSLSVPKFVEAYNVADVNEDWGTTLVIKFDVHMVKEQIESLYSQFGLIDSMNVRYTPSGAALHDDGKTVTFTFMNFNNARGTCKFQYFPGTIKSMANTNMESTYISFDPINLVPINIPVPEVEEIWNL